MYLFMADKMWVKQPKDLSMQRRWKPSIRYERKAETGENVDMVNLTRNFRGCSHHFHKEKISTDGYRSSDPVYFTWK